MKVSELIDALQKMPQGAHVVVYEWGGDGQGTTRKEVSSVEEYDKDAVIHHD